MVTSSTRFLDGNCIIVSNKIRTYLLWGTLYWIPLRSYMVPPNREWEGIFHEGSSVLRFLGIKTRRGEKWGPGRWRWRRRRSGNYSRKDSRLKLNSFSDFFVCIKFVINKVVLFYQSYMTPITFFCERKSCSVEAWRCIVHVSWIIPKVCETSSGNLFSVSNWGSISSMWEIDPRLLTERKLPADIFKKIQFLGTQVQTTHTCQVTPILFLHKCTCPEHVTQNYFVLLTFQKAGKIFWTRVRGL